MVNKRDIGRGNFAVELPDNWPGHLAYSFFRSLGGNTLMKLIQLLRAVLPIIELYN